MGAFLPALGASFGVDKIYHWRIRRRRRKRVAKVLPEVLSPEFRLFLVPRCQRKPPRSRRASTNKPAALSARRGTPGTSAGPDASFPPSQSSSSAQGQSQEEASVCLPHVSRSGCPSRSPAAEVHNVRLRFLVRIDRTPFLRREKYLTMHWETCFEKTNEKSHFSTSVSQFVV